MVAILNYALFVNFDLKLYFMCPDSFKEQIFDRVFRKSTARRHRLEHIVTLIFLSLEICS
jgi:hypothetical protein